MVGEKKDKKVQIKVTLETRERLKRKGWKGESYDDVITTLLDDFDIIVEKGSEKGKRV